MEDNKQKRMIFSASNINKLFCDNVNIIKAEIIWKNQVFNKEIILKRDSCFAE